MSHHPFRLRADAAVGAADLGAALLDAAIDI